MIVFVDEENRIKAVNKTDDETLRELVIDDGQNPFADWLLRKSALTRLMCRMAL